MDGSAPDTVAAVPFVKWAGGKRRLVATILAQRPADFARYLEPFVGGGAVALALGHRPMLLNDANGELIDAYRAVRDQLPALLAALDGHRAQHSAAYYYRVRALVAAALSPLERAARLIYLNKTCFNGLWRVNRRGQFNTPFGGALQPRLYDQRQIGQASEVLQGAALSALDYAEFLDGQARAGDLIYLDPPYVPVSRSADFKRYTPAQFGEADQQRLAELFHELVRRGAYPIVSNADTELTRWLYRDHCCHVVQAARMINHRGDGRGPAAELLVVPRGAVGASR